MSPSPPIRPGARPPDPTADSAGLRAFVAVARAGTVAGAAELLGLTQPSVSARLGGLEAAWGARLFRRHARGMALTPEGAALLPRAEAALRGLEELDRVAGMPLATSRELRVGAGDALGRERLPRALAHLLRRRPELEVHLREGPGSSLLEALREGEIDLALVVGPPPEGKSDAIDLVPCLSSEISLLVPEAGVPARRRSMRAGELEGMRVVTLQRGSGFRRHVESIYAAAGLAFRPAVEVGNLSLVRRFVAAGLGWAPVPAVAFSPRDRFRGVRTLRLAGASPVTYFRAVRAGAPLPEAARLLLDLLADGKGDCPLFAEQVQRRATTGDSPAHVPERRLGCLCSGRVTEAAPPPKTPLRDRSHGVERHWRRHGPASPDVSIAS